MIIIAEEIQAVNYLINGGFQNQWTRQREMVYVAFEVDFSELKLFLIIKMSI